MSRRFPIVVVTGSSGAGTTTVREAFEHMFRREGIAATIVRATDSTAITRAEMKAKIREAEAAETDQPLRAEGNLWPSSTSCSATIPRKAGGRFPPLSAQRTRRPPLRRGGSEGRDFTPWPRSSRAPNCCSTKACTAACAPGKST
jgi:phosphoribulokinase